MLKRHVLTGDFNFITTREELINNPPSQNELQLMRRGGGLFWCFISATQNIKGLC
jgi:hypothetical protein